MIKEEAQTKRSKWHRRLIASSTAFLWRLILAFLKIVVLFLLFLIAFGGVLYYLYGKDLPDPERVRHYHAFETTKIYARDGQTLLYELIDPHAGNRTVVPFDRIPRVLKDATIAVEDANFYQHSGVDPRGIIRALWLNLKSGRIVSGGSTITQQLARTLFFRSREDEQSLPLHQRYERKVREAILSFRMNQKYSKDEILGLYLNEVYYGARAYGVEAAAQTYFDKHVWELSDAEATLLAGLPQSPSILNPFKNMDGARARQHITLDLMVKNHYLTPGQATTIRAEPITLITPTTKIVAPHFAFYVRDLLEEHYSPERLYRGGLNVTTTLNLYWQNQAQRIVQENIAALRESNATNGSVVILSPEGDILAMVGSVDYNDESISGKVNVALSRRQPGSALKPLIYATALQRGWTPATVIWDTPTEFTSGGTAYVPLNYDHAWHGPQRMRTALANSLNIPAVKALEFAGIEYFVYVARQMGITTFDDPSRFGLSMALGSNEVRLLELTDVYNTLRNGGRHRPANAILTVANSEGELLEQWGTTTPKQTLGRDGEQIAYLITDMLSDNQARRMMFGYNNVMELPDGRPAAVKTGTSNDWRDSWALGYTPDVTVGVWVGNNDNSEMHEIAGSNGAGLVWRDIMMAYHEGLKPKPFEQPDRITERTICVPTGKLATEACPYAVREKFIEGQEPVEPDVFFQSVKVGNDGSCLAMSYTPPEEVREARYVRYPPEFQAWAEHNGIAQPPTEPCPPPQRSSYAVATLQPIGASGVVSQTAVYITGTARYPYTLEVGQGESPSQWQHVSRGNSPIRRGLLGVWNSATTPPGIYTFRLRVTTPEGMQVESRQRIQYQATQ